MKPGLESKHGRALLLGIAIVALPIIVADRIRVSHAERTETPARKSASIAPARKMRDKPPAASNANRQDTTLDKNSEARMHEGATAHSIRRVNVSARENFGRSWNTETRPAFAAFKQWTEQYLALDPVTRKTTLEKGVASASVRRSHLKQLIQDDPRLAIASAVPLTVRSQLPLEVLVELEEYISGTGELAFIGVTPGPDQPVTTPYFRLARVNRKHYEAFTYGRRAIPQSKVDISILGIAVDQLIAISESPMRILEPGETPARGKAVNSLCPISGQLTPVEPNTPLNSQEVTAVEVAGEVRQLCSPGHVAGYEHALILSEDAAGPYSGALILGGDVPGTSGIAGRPPISWTHGEKRVLIIRVDFSDKPGTPVNPSGEVVTEEFAVNVFNQPNGVRDFYLQGSYGKSTLTVAPALGGDSPDVTPVYRMPRAAQYYVTNRANTGQLHTDAQNAAASNGYNMADYDRVGVVTTYVGDIPGTEIFAGGLGSLQAKNFWLFGAYNFGVIAHEIGHNYGLLHANLWQISDGNPISMSGASVEYGDRFSVMGAAGPFGSGEPFQRHFSHWEKNLLQWLPDTDVQTIEWNGTYRIHRFDHQNASLSNPLALKIVRDATRNYWIGFRQAILTNQSLLNGAYILWGYNAVANTDVLDMTTPGADAHDAALAIGSVFNDVPAGISIQPLAKGGASPDEYLDVRIAFQPRVRWASTGYTFDEQLGLATLTLLRSANSNGVVSVNFATANGAALAPDDYAATNGVVTWGDGDIGPKTIAIPLVTDLLMENTENFTVVLSGISGGIIADASTAVTIADAGARDLSLAHEWIGNNVTRVLAQPDGKILIAGWFNYNQFKSVPFRRGGFSRLNADGSLDLDFSGEWGIPEPWVTSIFGIALQPDGKFIIVGNFTSVHEITRNRIARLNSDGSLDLNFDPGSGANGLVHAVAVQPDGMIVIGGAFTTINGAPREYIARLNPDGGLDTSFVGPNFGATSGWRVLCLALQSDNKILAGGAFYFPGPPLKSSIVRLNTNGSVDSSFNPGEGAHDVANPLTPNGVRSIVVQPDGRLIIGGTFTAFNLTPRNRIARLNPSGTLDTNFGPSAIGDVNAMLFQADRKILVAGTLSALNSIPVNRIARLLPSGDLDSTFTANIGSPSEVSSLAMQADGRVLVSHSRLVEGNTERTLTRLYAGVLALPGAVQFNSPLYWGIEGTDARLIVDRVGGSYGDISINYATVPGTATTNDFTPSTGTLSWTNGETTGKVISVPLNRDGMDEPTETLIVNLGVPIGGVFQGSPGALTVMIAGTNDLHTLAITDIRLIAPGLLRLQWQFPNASYGFTVEETSALPLNWQPAAGTNLWPVHRTNAVLPLGGAQRFFRVKAQP